MRISLISTHFLRRQLLSGKLTVWSQKCKEGCFVDRLLELSIIQNTRCQHHLVKVSKDLPMTSRPLSNSAGAIVNGGIILKYFAV